MNSEPGSGIRNGNSAAEEAEAWVGHGTVLLVEDEDLMRELAEEMLVRAGFVVRAATDGLEALEVFRVHAVECVSVLLDLTMPHMSGEQVLRSLREIRPDIPIIISSGLGASRILDRFPGAEGIQTLAKPYRYTQLVDALRAALGDD